VDDDRNRLNDILAVAKDGHQGIDVAVAVADDDAVAEEDHDRVPYEPPLHQFDQRPHLVRLRHTAVEPDGIQSLLVPLADQAGIGVLAEGRVASAALMLASRIPREVSQVVRLVVAVAAGM